MCRYSMTDIGCFYTKRESFREGNSMEGGEGSEEVEEPEPPKEHPLAISYRITRPPS